MLQSRTGASRVSRSTAQGAGAWRARGRRHAARLRWTDARAAASLRSVLVPGPPRVGRRRPRPARAVRHRRGRRRAAVLVDGDPGRRARRGVRAGCRGPRRLDQRRRRRRGAARTGARRDARRPAQRGRRRRGRARRAGAARARARASRSSRAASSRRASRGRRCASRSRTCSARARSSPRSTDLGIDHSSPEAAAAGEAFRALRGATRHLLAASGSGRELADAGSARRGAAAAAVDAASVVPVLRDGVFRRRSDRVEPGATAASSPRGASRA